MFQKNLIVWKLTQEVVLGWVNPLVSEELNSVETLSLIVSKTGMALGFRRT